jgi:hypothetical protein
MKSVYGHDVGAIWTALSEMQSNVDYMRRELPKMSLTTDFEKELVAVLGEFDSLLFDLRTEARNLEDKLGMHPGDAPFDPGIVNPDPRVTMRFLREWPIETFQMLNAVVQKLDLAAGSAYILVAESAVNMLNARRAMLAALERLDVLERAEKGEKS